MAGAAADAPTGVDAAGPSRDVSRARNTAWPGYAACAWGLVFAAISFYWGFGGRALADTVGGVGQAAQRGNDGVVILVFITGLLKLCAAGLALALVRPWGGWLPPRLTEGLGWTVAVGLTAYGAVLEAGAVVGVSGVASVTGPVDRRALLWHLWLWDLSFLVWGLLFFAALRHYRRAEW